MKKWILVGAICSLFLTACTADTQEMWDDLSKTFEPEKPRQAVKVTQGYPEPKTAYKSKQKKGQTAAVQTTVTNGRINTATRSNCQDLDDWYLDGFRVGKSFKSQKSAMFQQRVSQCNGIVTASLQQSWERGYRAGFR